MRLVIAGVVIGFAVSAISLSGCRASGARSGSSGGDGGGATARHASRTAASPSKLDVNTDPCAMRLHEVCGALLLYFAEHRDLPSTLEDLAKVPGATDAGELVCPVSHQPYLYLPAGAPSPDGESRIVLADAEPVHAGMRWAVVILPPGNGPLIAKVILIPEAQFPRIATTQPQRIDSRR